MEKIIEILMIVLPVIMLILLCCATYYDVKYKEVSDIVLMPFTVLGFIGGLFNKHYIALTIGLIIFLIVLLYKENNKIGGADLLLFAGFISLFGCLKIPQILFFPSAISLLLYFIDRKILKKDIISTEDGIAFIPSMLISVPFIFFINLPI